MSFIEIGQEIGELVEIKQAQYGDSFGKSGKILNILYPSGIPKDKMESALAVVRIIDKLFRIATGDPSDTEDPWRDIAGYALLGIDKFSNKD